MANQGDGQTTSRRIPGLRVVAGAFSPAKWLLCRPTHNRKSLEFAIQCSPREEKMTRFTVSLMSLALAIASAFAFPPAMAALDVPAFVPDGPNPGLSRRGGKVHPSGDFFEQRGRAVHRRVGSLFIRWEEKPCPGRRGAKATASSCLPGYPIHQVTSQRRALCNSHSWIAAGEDNEWAQIDCRARRRSRSRFLAGRRKSTRTGCRWGSRCGSRWTARAGRRPPW